MEDKTKKDKIKNGKLERLQKLWDEAQGLSKDIQEEAEAQKERAKDIVIENTTDEIDREKVGDFFEKPYVILPKSKNEAWVAVPRFVPFNVGWLERQTDSFNVFIVNKYVDWISEIPEDIKTEVGMEPRFDRAELVDDNVIEFEDEDEREEAWDSYRDNLYKRVDDNKVKINKGKEFDVIAEIIQDGNLPFRARPVDEDDLRGEPENVMLDDPEEVPEGSKFQHRAWDKFKDSGSVGIFWPPGSGKTFLSLYMGERIKGKKLVVVPSNTLKEQWRERISKLCSQSVGEWEIQTYQYLTMSRHMKEYQKEDIMLTVFDEVHHIPAPKFSKLATINTKYRIGLSASPYREDGKSEYIFALSGVPVGLKWRELIALGVVEEPDVKVYLYSTKRQKKKDLPTIIGNKPAEKIMVFCDSIDEGKRLSDVLGAPFVYGETSNRMEKFRDNRVVIASRVADEGLSVSDLDVAIEYDFLFGSRRQEAQRAGRVMHGEGKGEHIVMMTDDEYENYQKRLMSLENQGFRIRFERRR